MSTESIKNEERDFYQAYYLLQSQRQSQHESNRLTVSNFILAGSLVALGLATSGKSVSGPQLIVFLCAIILVNLLAILYANRSRTWVKVHQARASHALAALSEDLYNMQKGIDPKEPKDIDPEEPKRFVPEKMGKQRSGNSLWFNWTRSERVQSGFHVVLILAVATAVFLPH